MSFVNKQLHIGGMTCINCQNKIRQKLENTAGIEKVTVSYSKGIADITYDTDLISLKDIIGVIENLDYEVLTEDKTAQRDIVQVISLLVIIVALYILLQQSGILNLLVPSQLADTGMGYGMLFITGLLTSVHCIAMCGGINLSQCIPKSCKVESADLKEVNGSIKPDRTAEGVSKWTTFLPSVLYNLGRIISYTAIGFILGFLGMLIGGGSGTGISSFFQGILKLIAGIFMVIMGINMLNIFPGLRKFHLRMPGFMAAKISRQKVKSRQPLFIGLLNGLMPCGPLQSMQIVALASGNPFTGAFSMLLFSLGTVPLMLGLGSIVSALGKKFARGVMTVGAVLVVVLGLAMISQGGSLSGLLSPEYLLILLIVLCIFGVIASLPIGRMVYNKTGIVILLLVVVITGTAWRHGAAGSSVNNTNSGVSDEVEIVDDVQVVTSTLSPGRYPDITVQAGIPVKWVIDAPEGSINGCNYKLVIQDYGMEYTFQEGENIIEFTPEQAGTVQYTCWMGMIHGNIFVTEGEGASTVKADDSQTVDEGGSATGNDSAADQDTSVISDSDASNAPVPAGYTIPSENLAIAEKSVDSEGNTAQEVTITLTAKGFEPAVVVVEKNIAVTWVIQNELQNVKEDSNLLVPLYSTKLPLVSGENIFYLYPADSFEVSTDDNVFYAYVKVVDDLDHIDSAAIQEEVSQFETLIYPETIYGSSGAGGSCCD